MLSVNCQYNIKEDIEFILESEMINNIELSERTGVSRMTLDAIARTGTARDDVCEKIYSYIYGSNYRINSVKEELIKEKYKNVLFHGSKSGLDEVVKNGSRENCDFGRGFYLGETYSQALAFVSENEKSSVYSFRYSLDNLKIKQFDCNLEWMLAICCFRGVLKKSALNHEIVDIIKEVESSDVVISPIADNKMFYIMAQFTDGEINADVALHSLSASSLGNQYIFRTDKALRRLKPVERYYLSNREREDCRKMLTERSYEIDTKLKLAKRKYRNGLYIEEILK